MRSALRSSAIVLLALLACSLLLMWLGWGALIDPGIPSGDYAADMLLGNRIRDESLLLVGHYSRFGFSHPGPFWFYYNHLFELLLLDSGLSRTQIWLVGQVVISSLLTTFSACGLSILLTGRVTLAQTLLAISVLICLTVNSLLGLWMPMRLVSPYSAFLVSCLLLAQGRSAFLPISMLIAGMLIHGYATMPLFTLPFLLVAAYFGLYPLKARVGLSISLTIFAAIALIFLMPIIYDAFLNSPSNLHKLLGAQKGFINQPSPTWPDMLIFARELMPAAKINWLILASALALFLLRVRNHNLLRALALLSASSVLLIFYYKTTPAPIYGFVAQFFTTAPALLFAALLICLSTTIGERLKVPRRLAPDVIALTMSFCLVFWLGLTSRLPAITTPTTNEFSEFSDFLEHKLKPDEMLALDYAQHDNWGFMAGLLLELDHRKIPACTTWRHMAFLYTEREVCPPELQPQYRVVPANQCDKQCTFSTLNHGLRPVKLQSLALATPYDHNSQALLFQNWYPSEALHRWSLGNASSIIFKLDKQAPTPSELSILLNSFGLQRIEIFLNEQRIYAGELNGAQIPLIIPLKQGIIQTANNTLRFALPDARQPQTADPRALAVAFLRLQLNPKKP